MFQETHRKTRSQKETRKFFLNSAILSCLVCCHTMRRVTRVFKIIFPIIIHFYQSLSEHKTKETRQGSIEHRVFSCPSIQKSGFFPPLIYSGYEQKSGFIDDVITVLTQLKNLKVKACEIQSWKKACNYSILKGKWNVGHKGTSLPFLLTFSTWIQVIGSFVQIQYQQLNIFSCCRQQLQFILTSH